MFVSQTHRERITISLRVGNHATDTHLTTCPDDPQRYLATVSNHNLTKHTYKASRSQSTFQMETVYAIISRKPDQRLGRVYSRFVGQGSKPRRGGSGVEKGG